MQRCINNLFSGFVDMVCNFLKLFLDPKKVRRKAKQIVEPDSKRQNEYKNKSKYK